MELELPSRRGLRPSSRQIDRQLWLWFCRARHSYENEGGPRVSKKIVQAEAKRAFHCAGVTNFKASDGWYWRWLHRWRRLDPSSTSGKGDRGSVKNKTAETLPKTVTTGKSPELEVTFSSTIETPATKLSTPSTKNVEHPSIRLETSIDCGNTLQKNICGRDPLSFTEQVTQQSQLLCDGNNTQYWTDYVRNGPLSCPEMMTENHFYHGENLSHNSQVDQHNSIPVNIQQTNISSISDNSLSITDQCGNDLNSGQILHERLHGFDLAFNNQNTNLLVKFMSYDIGDSYNNLANEEVCLMDGNISQNEDHHSFPQLANLANSNQSDLPMQNSEANLSCLMFDSGLTQTGPNDDFSINTGIPLQSGSLDHTNADAYGTTSNAIPDYNPPEQLNCSVIQDLSQSLEDPLQSKVTSMYDVIASMTSSLLSPSNDLSDAFCMSNQSTCFGSKNGHTNIDSIDIGTCQDQMDSRADNNLMDVVLDPLNTDGQQYVANCDSGIDVSPLATEDASDFSNLNGNPFESNIHLQLNTDPAQPRDDDCDMFLNFNSDDSVGITDLIPMGETDDCMNDDDSLPEDYLEFIDNFEHSTSQEVSKGNEISDVPAVDSKTEKAPSPRGDAVKARRTGGERYLPSFKQKVLKYAAAHTFKEAAARFSVNVDSITLWALKSRQAVIEQNPEKHFLVWLRRCRETGHSINREKLRSKVSQLLSVGSGLPKREETGWFYVWAKRIVISNDEGSGEELKTTSKAAYPPAFKTEVALFAETTSKNNASLVFGVARKRVYEWLAGLRDITEDHDNDKDEGFNKGAKNMANISPGRAVVPKKQRGREVTNAQVDKELLEWFHKMTSTKQRPTGSQVRSKAVELFRSHGHLEISCSHGWYRRWCTRHGLAIRHSGDEEVLAWCLQELDRGKNVTQRDLLAAAHTILSGKHKSEFKASAGWARRFAWRHGALFSRWPQLESDTFLPPLLARRAVAFGTRVQRLIKDRSWSASVIGTMDEVPLSLTASGTSNRGTSLLHRPWPESVHATVILACLANGELLHPTVVLKGVGEPESMTIGKTTVLVFRQQDAIVDEDVLLQWLDLVWFRSGISHTRTKPTESAESTHSDETDNSESLLIMDSYEPHGSARVEADLAARKCRLALIPAGCGSALLPLASWALRTFRGALEREQQSEHRSASASASACQPQLAAVAARVARAHVTLAAKKEMLRRSFQMTGFIGDNCDENIIGNLSTLVSRDWMAGRMTPLLVMLLVAMLFLSDAASATFRKPPFNGSIFGKRGSTNDIEAAGQTLSSLCAVATEACGFWFPADN